MAKEVAISIKNVTKSFLLPHQRASTLKSKVLHPIKRTNDERRLVLDNLTFDVEKGEFFGIVGRNGSGKSTLLKCIAGVYIPEKGSIRVNGTLVPFIELGVGFNNELSGRDNIYLNASLLGFNRKEIGKIYDKIVDFSELEEFMDQKLKNYSSGMQVRLAFSIAIQAKGDILILDEVLAVGDAAFKQKCNDYFYQLKEQKRTIVLVTHSMSAVQEYCDRAMIIHGGKVLDIGDPEKISDIYNDLNFRIDGSPLDRRNTEVKKIKKEMSLKGTDKPTKAEIINIETYDPTDQKKTSAFSYKDKIGVRFTIGVKEKIDSPTVGVVFRDRKNNKIFGTNTKIKNIEIKDQKTKDKFTVEFIIDNVFANTNYKISGAVASADRSDIYHRVENFHEFNVYGWKTTGSMTNPNHSISVEYRS